VPINLDNAFGIHPTALALRAKRMEVLATNLAHADTPNYKAMDIDFKSVLAQANAENSSVMLRATHQNHLGPSGRDSGAGESLYRIPYQPAIDGNTVDTQIEQAEFGRNAISYQASLTFLNGRIRSLLTAIKGDSQ
jgi:flagellar basal-body rod protein FlgB